MDTIIIKVYGPKKFDFRNRDWFLPEINPRSYRDLSPTEQRSMRQYLRHFKFHPPHQQAYQPKMDVFEALTKNLDDVLYILKIEFSAPKLLYGNSVEEVTEADYGRVLSALERSLALAGVEIENDAIASASVSGVHFCKNILFPPNIRMQEALDELWRADISKAVDLTQKEFKNAGRVLHFYSGTVERVFYDKIIDTLRPKVKRKDKGQMTEERKVVERYGLLNQELFRYEYRVKKGQTVKREVNAALGRPPDVAVVFKDLFTPNLCRTLILKSWRGLIGRPENQLALLGMKEDFALLTHVLKQARRGNKNVHSLNRALIAYGLARAIHDHGTKEVRKAIFRIWNTDHPERLTNKIKAAAELSKGLPYSNSIAFIDNRLEKFEPLTLTLVGKDVQYHC